MQDIIDNAEDIADTYFQLSSFEKSLEDVETVLMGFQGKLNSLSSEIQSLQRKSTELNYNLRKNTIIKKNLEKYIGNIDISDEFLNRLFPEKSNFVKDLDKLSRMIQFTKSEDIFLGENEDSENMNDKSESNEKITFPAPRVSSFMDDIVPRIERMKLQVVHRIKQYLMLCFESQDIGTLFKIDSKIILFIKEYSPHSFSEITEELIKSLSRIILNYIDVILNAVITNQPTSKDEIWDKYLFERTLMTDDTIQDGQNCYNFNFNSRVFSNSDFYDSLTKVVSESKSSIWQESSFINKLMATDRIRNLLSKFIIQYIGDNTYFSPKVPFHDKEMLSIFQDGKVPFDIVMLILLCCLNDKMNSIVVLTEKLFISSDKTELNQIIRYTQLFLVKRLQPNVLECRNIKELISCYNFLHEKQFNCRNIFDNITAVLETRLNSLLEENLALLPDANTIQKYKTNSVYDVQITHKFCWWFFELLKYNLTLSLKLQDTYLEFLFKVKEQNCKNKIFKSEKNGVVFLINNLQIIYQNLKDYKVNFPESTLSVEKVEAYLLSYREIFVEESLKEILSKMINFILSFETGSKEEVVELNKTEAVEIAADFKLHWLEGMGIISSCVDNLLLEGQSSLKKQCFTQLLLYYSRFKDLVQKEDSQSNNSSDIVFVEVSEIMASVKKFELGQEDY